MCHQHLACQSSVLLRPSLGEQLHPRGSARSRQRQLLLSHFRLCLQLQPLQLCYQSQSRQSHCHLQRLQPTLPRQASLLPRPASRPGSASPERSQQLLRPWSPILQSSRRQTLPQPFLCQPQMLPQMQPRQDLRPPRLPSQSALAAGRLSLLNCQQTLRPRQRQHCLKLLLPSPADQGPRLLSRLCPQKPGRQRRNSCPAPLRKGDAAPSSSAGTVT